MRPIVDVVSELVGASTARWDAIRVPRHIGLATLKQLPIHDLPIIIDPDERMVDFLVPARVADHWTLPSRRILVGALHVALPPAHQRTPPGRYWLTEPVDSVCLTSPRVLHKALECAYGEATVRHGRLHQPEADSYGYPFWSQMVPRHRF
ncbi:hypothetical protein ABZT47_28695 [Sphaerisporangium sp. NPDC005289]|uniref:hypothetical protein n=1 Tax=Sphaerisporangium sp. NPDC005289 TaxID=3155247 RepID=UPI0033B7698C